MVGNPEPLTLVVLEGKWYFEFFFDVKDDNRSWRVRDHPDYPEFFLVEEKEDGWVVREFYDAYENASVEDLRGLLESLIKEPEETLEGLFGEKFQIKEVKVEKVDEDEDIYNE
jgi:hypothetical protein